MSYTIRTRDAITGTGFRSAVDAAIEEQSPRGSDGSVAVPGAQSDHIGAAVAAIEQWLLPVVGDQSLDTYQVTIAGHANPGHRYSDDGATEYIDIRIECTHARPDAEGEVVQSEAATHPDNVSELEETPLVPVPPQRDAVDVTQEQHDAGNADANAAGTDPANTVDAPDPAAVDVTIEPEPSAGDVGGGAVTDPAADGAAETAVPVDATTTDSDVPPADPATTDASVPADGEGDKWASDAPQGADGSATPNVPGDIAEGTPAPTVDPAS